MNNPTVIIVDLNPAYAIATDALRDTHAATGSFHPDPTELHDVATHTVVGIASYTLNYMKDKTKPILQEIDAKDNQLLRLAHELRNTFSSAEKAIPFITDIELIILQLFDNALPHYTKMVMHKYWFENLSVYVVASNEPVQGLLA